MSGTKAFANLVVDGDFETLPLSASWQYSLSSTVQMVDFSMGHNGSSWFVHMLGLVYDGPPPPPYSPATMSQAVTLQSGMTYELSFWAHGDNVTTTYNGGGLTVSISSAPGTFFLASSSLTSGSPTDWKQYTTTFTPTGSGTLLFSYQDSENGLNGGAVGRGIYLDDITLNAVPEPGTVMAGLLLLLPLGASGLRVLRKRTA